MKNLAKARIAFMAALASAKSSLSLDDILPFGYNLRTPSRNHTYHPSGSGPRECARRRRQAAAIRAKQFAKYPSRACL